VNRQEEENEGSTILFTVEGMRCGGCSAAVQKVIVKAWRKEWKRALAEYAEENGDPELAAAVGPLEDE